MGSCLSSQNITFSVKDSYSRCFGKLNLPSFFVIFGMLLIGIWYQAIQLLHGKTIGELIFEIQSAFKVMLKSVSENETDILFFKKD